MSLSLRTKLILQILPIFIAIVVGSAGFVVITTSKIDGDLANKQMLEMVQHYAYQIQADMILEKYAGDKLAEAVEAMDGYPRNALSSALHNLLNDSTSLNGAFLVFEPNAFDNADRNFANQGYWGKTGRFAVYWKQGQDNPENEEVFFTGPLVDDYQAVLKTQKPAVFSSNPSSKDFLIQYLIPIQLNGKPVGVLGVDLPSTPVNQVMNNLEIFKTGYGFLVDHKGTILAAQVEGLVGNGAIYQAAIQKKTTDFDTLNQKVSIGTVGSLATGDPVHGEDAMLFYAPIQATGWSLVLAAPQSEMMETTILLRNVLIGLAIVAVIFLIFYVAYIAGRISKPIQQMGIAAEKIAGGDLEVTLKHQSTDEIGQMANSFREMVEYLRGMAGIAQKISEGDLSLEVQPTSERDVLGNAYAQMISSLRTTVQDVADNAEQVYATSQGMAGAVRQSSDGTLQISATMQQVARGASDQSASVQNTVDAVFQMRQAIQQLRTGMQAQTEAISNASLLTEDMSRAIDHVAENARSVTHNAETAALSAKTGAQKVGETLAGMQTMKEQVGHSSIKVEEMGAKSGRIGDMVETIDEIASQTNLLALNAAIETARAEVQARNLTEAILNHEMIAQAHLISQILVDQATEPTTTFWKDICHRSGLSSISISDADGVVVYSDDQSALGFRFSDDPKSESYPFRKLINQKNSSCCQPPQKRGMDGRTFKYVGISREDEPGIVQVAFDADTLANFALKLGGFAVVSDEVRKLAEKSREAAQEIHGMTRDIQHAVHESVTAMKSGMVAVESSVNQALASGEALKDIQMSVETVLAQAQQSAKTAQAMTDTTHQMLAAMGRVGQVTQENVLATDHINQNAVDVSQAMDSLASLGEENGSAVEEVSATVEEISAQVEDVANSAKSLEDMAQSLRDVVRRFTLTEEAEPASTDQPVAVLAWGR